MSKEPVIANPPPPGAIISIGRGDNGSVVVLVKEKLFAISPEAARAVAASFVDAADRIERGDIPKPGQQAPPANLHFHR